MPRARQAFAIFFREHRVVQKGASRTAFAAELVELGKRWKALTELEKEPYKERSRAEFKTRKDFLLNSGFSPRRRAARQGSQQLLSNGSKPESDFFQLGPYQIKAAQETVLGKGAYGKVFFGTRKDGLDVAVKLFCGRHSSSEASHEICKYKAVFALEAKHTVWFAPFLGGDEHAQPCPYLALSLWGQSLNAWLKTLGRFDPPKVHKIALQLQAAVQILHGKAKFLHLDIKPQNILWSQELSQLKLCDLGMCEPICRPSDVPEPLRFAEYVTSLYRPPELWSTPSNSPEMLRAALTTSVDLWSCGCVVYEAGAAVPLFKPRDMRRGPSSYIPSWCLQWGALQAVTAKFDGETKMWHARLLICSPWSRAFVLQACHPDPALRTFPSRALLVD